jgi:hypothetical protein
MPRFQIGYELTTWGPHPTLVVAKSLSEAIAEVEKFRIFYAVETESLDVNEQSMMEVRHCPLRATVTHVHEVGEGPEQLNPGLKRYSVHFNFGGEHLSLVDAESEPEAIEHVWQDSLTSCGGDPGNTPLVVESIEEVGDGSAEERSFAERAAPYFHKYTVYFTYSDGRDFGNEVYGHREIEASAIRSAVQMVMAQLTAEGKPNLDFVYATGGPLDSLDLPSELHKDEWERS